jgi:hypothetical protein
MGYTYQQIADHLNDKNIPKLTPTKWCRSDVGVTIMKWKRRKEREQDTQVMLSSIEITEE